MIYKTVEERDRRIEAARFARDCDACGGMSGCLDCSELTGTDFYPIKQVWLNGEQVYVDPSIKESSLQPKVVK